MSFAQAQEVGGLAGSRVHCGADSVWGGLLSGTESSIGVPHLLGVL